MLALMRKTLRSPRCIHIHLEATFGTSILISFWTDEADSVVDIKRSDGMPPIWLMAPPFPSNSADGVAHGIAQPRLGCLCAHGKR